jgi:hypothetical protein
MKNKRPLTQKILKKFLGLLDKGLDLDSCLGLFEDYRDELGSYVEMIGRFKDLKALNIKEDYLKQNLKNIYANARIENLKDQNHISKKDMFLIRFRPAYLKPLTVFLSVFVFFSFSFAGTVYASTDTVPGEALYTVKRASESVQIAFTPHGREGDLYFKFLTRRLNEADVIFQKNDEIALSFAGDLLTDIDYNYNKCLENKYQGLNDGGKMKGRINKLKEDFNEKCRMQGTGQGKQNMGQNASGQSIDGQQYDSQGNQLQSNTTNKEQYKNIQSGNDKSDGSTENNAISTQTGNQYNYGQCINQGSAGQGDNLDTGTGNGIGQTDNIEDGDYISTETTKIPETSIIPENINGDEQNPDEQGNSTK